MDKRLENEIAHGRFLHNSDAGKIWNWETAAGKKRWNRRVRMLTSHLMPYMDVLEIGCGNGLFTKEIAKIKCHLTAIDISEELLEDAKKRVNQKKVIFKVDNAYDLSFRDCEFDSVIGSSILHHLDIDRVLQELMRILKPEGTICFTEPNMLNPQIAIQKNIKYFKKLSGDSPDETAFFKWQLKNLLKKFGFVDIRVNPFDFLHPKIPYKLLHGLEPICKKLETIPLIKEFSGSLFISARKHER